MATTIGTISCAENYQKVAIMGSTVGDPIPAGIGCLTEADFDTIDAGSVSLFYESSLAELNSESVPKDYVNTGASNTLITIPMNNFFDDSRKIYAAQATSLPYDKAATELTKLANKSARQNACTELACLATEGTKKAGEEITSANIKQTILDDQSAIRNTGANPTIAVCTPEFYAKLVIAAGESLKTVEADNRWLSAIVGSFLGIYWVSSPLLAKTDVTYINAAGTKTAAAFTDVDYVMWDGSKFAAINRINEFAIKDGGAVFAGSAACMSSMLGVKLLEATACIVRTSPAIVPGG